MNDETRLTLLKDEYIMLQGFYEDIDRRCLTIKEWSILAAGATIGAGLTYSPMLFVGTTISAILFWFLEAFYRSLSFFFAARIKEIEAAMREKESEPAHWKTMPPLQTYQTWITTYKNEGGGKTKDYLFRSATLMPHAPVVVVSIVLLILTALQFDLSVHKTG